MNDDPHTHQRRSVRLRGYDYSRPGQYFVTVCTYRRELLFGEIIRGQMRRNELGDMVHAEWYATERIRPEIRLDAFIVMPNHLHGIIEITDVEARRRLAPDVQTKVGNERAGATHRIAPTEAVHQRPTGPTSGSIGAIIGQVKSLTKKALNRTRDTPGLPVWQPNYHEHIIRNREELERIREYICTNPLKWPSDRENPARPSDITDDLADIVLWDREPWIDS